MGVGFNQIALGLGDPSQTGVRKSGAPLVSERAPDRQALFVEGALGSVIPLAAGNNGQVVERPGEAGWMARPGPVPQSFFLEIAAGHVSALVPPPNPKSA